MPRFTLISPRIAVQKGDFLGSGVPYWPVELATLAGFLRDRGTPPMVIDMLGNAPMRFEHRDDHFLQGETIDRFLDKPEVQAADVFILYAMSYMSHGELIEIVRTLRRVRPEAKVAVLENSQAVTAYSLPRLAPDFFEAGADALICGEPYFNWDAIEAFLTGAPGAERPGNVLTAGDAAAPLRLYQKKDGKYPIPAWELFRIEGYFKLPYSHGPKTPRFLPVLTSRGCPYPCDFCVVPETNDRRWRERSAADVVEELIVLRDNFGVRDFQIEDLNPTVRHERFDDICNLLIERKAGIRFYIVSGTKAETVPIDQVPLLAKAGCRYISISPESGSADLMKTIGKPFRYDHGLDLVTACRKHGIRTQACFLVGHPSETESDFEASRSYLASMIRAGLDEVAVFVVAPFAGSALYAQSRIGVTDTRAMPSFSPKGRADYEQVERRRSTLIKLFFAEKLRRGLDLWMQGLRAVLGRPQTKMENLPWRIAFIRWHTLWAKPSSISAPPSAPAQPSDIRASVRA